MSGNRQQGLVVCRIMHKAVDERWWRHQPTNGSRHTRIGYMQHTSLTRFAWLSIGAAIVTIGLKMGAYWITGSIGLLSDALESLVNLVAAVMALAMLTVAARPPDEDHAYGHYKAE